VEIQNVDNMPKTKLSDIVKKGAKLKAKKIDFDDPEVKTMINAIKEEQKKCLERKKVDWNKLNKMRVNF
jgi:hypothetical protein